MAKVYVGTSGFNYKHWGNGIFYPKGLSQPKWLEYYSKQFKSVELNVTFYRLPKGSTFEKWYSETPKDFVFAIKGSRFISHVKKLKNCKEALDSFFKESSGLGEKLGIVLWQLPGNLHADFNKLGEFCDLIKKTSEVKKVRHSFEFRHESWFCEDIYKILRKNNFSLCIAHSNAWPCVEAVTADYLYLRFHGGELYTSNYSDLELKEWVKKAKKWMGEGRDIYAYFNNDALGFAVENAETLAKLLIS